MMKTDHENWTKARQGLTHLPAPTVTSFIILYDLCDRKQCEQNNNWPQNQFCEA